MLCEKGAFFIEKKTVFDGNVPSVLKFCILSNNPKEKNNCIYVLSKRMAASGSLQVSWVQGGPIYQSKPNVVIHKSKVY